MIASSVLFVFARAPEPGRVKTRLIPSVGAEGAASLHEAFIDDVCTLTRGVVDTRILSIAGDVSHPHLEALARREGIERVPQGQGDLGSRMDEAISSALARGASRVAIVGTDSPTLPSAHVTAALDALGDRDVVLGPADDGGYWLVGARRPVPWLFSDMPWGTSRVLAESLRRLDEQAAAYALADRFWDIDEPADLERLRLALQSDGDPTLAPATRLALARLRR